MNYVKQAEETIDEIKWIEGEMEKVRNLIAELTEARTKANEKLASLKQEEDTDYNRLMILRAGIEDSAWFGVLDEAKKTLAHLGLQLKVQYEVLNTVKGNLYLARRDLHVELQAINAKINKALNTDKDKSPVEIADIQSQRRSMMSLMGKMTKAIASITMLPVSK